jgi:tetratricopeptide (TPR) repeat protein
LEIVDQNQLRALAQRASQAYAQGDYRRAVQLCDGLIARFGPVPHLLNLKAISLIALSEFEAAEAPIRRALKANPGLAGVQANAAVVYSKLSRRKQARRHALEASRLAPREPGVLYPVAMALRESGDHDRALRITQRILQIDPDSGDTWHLKGSLETDLGDVDAAGASLEKAVSLQPANTRALSALVKLRRSSLADTETVELLQSIRAGGQDAWDRPAAIFALAGIYDRAGEFDQAFQLYKEANAGSAVSKPFDIERYEQGVDATIESTLDDEFEAAAPGSPGENLVFIIGMPRSGTSLCEQVVSAHSGVLGCGELIAMERVEQALEREGVVPCLDNGPHAASAEQLAQGRSDYLAALPADYSEYQRVTDKAPMNFQRLTLIHRLFPGARFLYCTRHPLDTVLSCYFHDFQAGMNFSFRMEHILRVYAAQLRLMRHWRRLLGACIHTVSYPELVTDLEAVSRAAACFLGIDFEPAMLQPHLNPRVVNTASSWQVRQPVYDSALDVWKHYENHLDPVIAYLRNNGVLDGELRGPLLD